MMFKPYREQSYEILKQKQLKKETKHPLFEDPIFDASYKSLYQYSCPKYISTTLNFQYDWKRPKEIVEDPKFIVDKANYHQVRTGPAGENCWFIIAMVNIANRPEYFKVVVPDDQSFDSNDYCGIFHFRFWQYGEWVDVVIDDRLPVDRQNKLLYCSNPKSPNEFWCCLLEKAYAKLVTCYEYLNVGYIHDGLMDMTGGVSECVDLSKMVDFNPETLWNFIYKVHKMGSLGSAGIHQPTWNENLKEVKLDSQEVKEEEVGKGLLTSNAYSITKVAEVPLNETSKDKEGSNNNPPNKIRLIRLRDPEGKHGWTGAWSNGSNEWNLISDKDKQELESNYDSYDEFWMSFQDFLKNFKSLDFVHINLHAFYDEINSERPSTYSDWNCKEFHGEWVPNVSAGGSGLNSSSEYWKNPQWWIRIKGADQNDNAQKVTLIVSILCKMQTEVRFKNRGQLNEFPKQLRLFQVKKQFLQQKQTSFKFDANHLERIGSSQSYSLMREVSMRFRLDPGEYVIIPSTYDANVPGKFLLRLFTEIDINDVDVSNLEHNNPKNEHNDSNTHFNEVEDTLFDRFGNVVSSDDMNQIMDELESKFLTNDKNEDEPSNNEISEKLLDMSGANKSLNETRNENPILNKYRRVPTFEKFFKYKDQS